MRLLEPRHSATPDVPDAPKPVTPESLPAGQHPCSGFCTSAPAMCKPAASSQHKRPVPSCSAGRPTVQGVAPFGPWVQRFVPRALGLKQHRTADSMYDDTALNQPQHWRLERLPRSKRLSHRHHHQTKKKNRGKQFFKQG